MALYKEIASDVASLDNCGHTTKDIGLILGASERTVRRARQWLKEEYGNPVTPKDPIVDELPEEEVEYEVVFKADFDVNAQDVEEAVEASKNVEDKYVVMASETSITISYGDESETITKSDDKFELVSDIVWEGRGSQAALAEAFNMMSYKQEFIQLTDGLVDVDSAKGVVMYDNCQISPALAERIIQACQDGDRQMLQNLVEFTKKLHENPSRRAVMELYSFLQAADILIRDDGMVECYKRVRSDYYDFFTQKTRNKPGDAPAMHRWEVDEDKSRTCSQGYHVCSKSYLPSYHNGTGRIVKCLVHPADFVAIPVDYNFAKARVWRYKVVSEVHNM